VPLACSELSLLSVRQKKRALKNLKGKVLQWEMLFLASYLEMANLWPGLLCLVLPKELSSCFVTMD